MSSQKTELSSVSLSKKMLYYIFSMTYYVVVEELS